MFSSGPATITSSPSRIVKSGARSVMTLPSRSTAITVQPVSARMSAPASVSPTSAPASNRTTSTCLS
jgi:hypothetical protein